MLVCSPRATALIAIFAVLGLHHWAEAHEAGVSEPSLTAPVTDDEPPPELVPFRRDAIGKHLQAGITANLLLPFGSVSEAVAVWSRAGLGGSGTLDVTYGLDRFVALGIYGEMGWFGNSGACGDCSATLLGAGGQVRYHVGQGLRFDPWVSYGLGLLVYGARSDAEVFHYAGLEVVRFQVGANWYANRHLTLGPVLGLGAAHMIDRPEGERSGGPFMRGSVGLRVAFDMPGRF
jgi:hypothetical protein